MAISPREAGRAVAGNLAVHNPAVVETNSPVATINLDARNRPDPENNHGQPATGEKTIIRTGNRHRAATETGRTGVIPGEVAGKTRIRILVRQAEKINKNYTPELNTRRFFENQFSHVDSSKEPLENIRYSESSR